jgi:hypothetical protein
MGPVHSPVPNFNNSYLKQLVQPSKETIFIGTFAIFACSSETLLKSPFHLHLANIYRMNRHASNTKSFNNPLKVNPDQKRNGQAGDAQITLSVAAI